MENYQKILKQLEKKHAPALLKNNNLICKQMPHGDDATLYIAKKHWTNRFDQQRESTVGIFFCVWVSPETLEKEEFSYNIHSMKLRKLPGYKLASREFASHFRSKLGERVASWPNISMNYGPLTLLEGSNTCDLQHFAENVEKRITDFVDIHKEIDNLLDLATH